MCHEMTVEEIRRQFIEMVLADIDYWDRQAKVDTQRERLEGLACSLLVILDGDSAGLPAFVVAPDPHPSDRAYSQETDQDWFPEVGAARPACDIAGRLHELLYEVQRERRG